MTLTLFKRIKKYGWNEYMKVWRKKSPYSVVECHQKKYIITHSSLHTTKIKIIGFN